MVTAEFQGRSPFPVRVKSNVITSVELSRPFANRGQTADFGEISKNVRLLTNRSSYWPQ